ncbi:uncharacterized protein TNCV_84881 [Trichonephila clavipes]|nr:uncharacterized protein TNCV_84881 [Trichonephila clavipes]
MKILLQELWKLNLEWDEPIPEDLNKQWTTFRKELHLIEKMKIPRCVLLPSYIQLEIHAFCDSSVRAYCTAIYLKCIASESISVSLLTSKTRVAPLKTQSLPRLELCAALLLSNVLQVVLREFPLSIHRTIAWTDSTITLAWLKTEPYRWQPFVANRVSKIQTTIPSVEWCHVSGIENPADLGTRGLLPSQLVAHDQWIHGPLWLNQPMNETSSYKIPETFSFPDNALKEKRSVVTCVAKIVPLPEFIDRISSFTKLVRVCAWILRFIKNSRSPVSRTFGYLKSSELHTAVVTIVRLIQQAEFPNEFKCLFQGNPLPKDNKLLPLNLFCDSEGVLRVGGRLSRNTRLSYDQKHPMLLPKSHEFTRKVINFYHITYLHAGPQLTLSLIRQKFWFVDGRSVVRHTLKKCLICFKMNLRSSSQLMGDLPPIRFQQIRPFESTGLDFAGPLTTKCAHKRSVTKFKSYICLFICTATKAVHLELVSDLSTAAFLAALRRFIARRSCPSKIISDNGSNFKGASSHLRKLVDLCLQEEVQNFLSLKGIEWSFIPPYTPHFGGLWESAIKSAKQLLIKATNSVLLNFEECSTLLIQIEACLNSRPLTELSPDPSDFTALTPAHFLVGGPIHQFPEPSQPSRSVPLSERWNLIQRLRQYFWDRWSTEYLHRLQPRSKWWRTKPNLQLGDMVIVEKEKTAPLNWTLGRINKLFFGPDQRYVLPEHSLADADRKLYKLQSTLRHLEGMMKTITPDEIIQNESSGNEPIEAAMPRMETRSTRSGTCNKRDNVRKEMNSGFPARRHYEAEGRANEDADIPTLPISSQPPNLIKWREFSKMREKLRKLQVAEKHVKVIYDIMSSIREAKKSGRPIKDEHLELLSSLERQSNHELEKDQSSSNSEEEVEYESILVDSNPIEEYGIDVKKVSSEADNCTLQEVEAKLSETQKHVKLMKDVMSSLRECEKSGKPIPIEHLHVLVDLDKDSDCEIDSEIDSETIRDNNPSESAMNQAKVGSSLILQTGDHEQEDTSSLGAYNTEFVARRKRDFMTFVSDYNQCAGIPPNERKKSSGQLKELSSFQSQLHGLMETSSDRRNEDVRSSGEGGYIPNRNSENKSPLDHVQSVRPVRRHQDNLLTRQNVATMESQNQSSSRNLHSRAQSSKKDNINNLSGKMEKLSIQNSMNGPFAQIVDIPKDNIDSISTLSSELNQSRSGETERKTIIDILTRGKKKQVYDRNRDDHIHSNSSIDSEPLECSNSVLAVDTTVAATWGGSSTQENFEDETEEPSRNLQRQHLLEGASGSSYRPVPKLKKISKMGPLRGTTSGSSFEMPNSASCSTDTTKDYQQQISTHFIQQLRKQISQLNALCQEELLNEGPQTSMNFHQNFNPNLLASCQPHHTANDIIHPYNQQLLLCLSQCYHTLYLQQLEIQNLNRYIRHNIDSEVIHQANNLNPQGNNGEDFEFRPWCMSACSNPLMPSNMYPNDQVSPRPTATYLQLPMKPYPPHSAPVAGTRPVRAVIHPASQENRTAQETLNNQVPPRTRANNFWDNFRSYSRQNLLSTSNTAKRNENIGLPVAPQIRQVHPMVSNGNMNSGPELTNSLSSSLPSDLNRSIVNPDRHLPNQHCHDIPVALNPSKKPNANAPTFVIDGQVSQSIHLIQRSIVASRLRKNLMSSPMLDQNRLKFIGVNGQIKVYTGNKLIFKANLEQGLFYAYPNIEPKYASSVEKAIKIEGKPNYLMTWHERFGHINVDYILKTSLLDAARGLPELKKPLNFECVPCRLNKYKRVSFQSIECTRSKAPLNLLHCNVWGPANVIEKGIKHERTNIYMPQQNGAWEYRNRTLIDKARTVPSESGLDKSFWPKAVIYFVHVWNRLCHSGQTLTPIELHIAIKPSIRHLRPFGSILYLGTPRPFREKLDLKAKKKGILVGFVLGTRGYRMWIPEDSRVIETSNIRFQKPQKSNSGVVLASPDLRFSDYEVVENCDDKTVNNIPASLPQNSDSETEDEESSRTNRSVVPVKTTWKRVVVPLPDGSRNDIYYYELGKSQRLRSCNEIKYCMDRKLEFDESIFNFKGKDTFEGIINPQTSVSGVQSVEVKNNA